MSAHIELFTFYMQLQIFTLKTGFILYYLNPLIQNIGIQSVNVNSNHILGVIVAITI